MVHPPRGGRTQVPRNVGQDFVESVIQIWFRKRSRFAREVVDPAGQVPDHDQPYSWVPSHEGLEGPPVDPARDRRPKTRGRDRVRALILHEHVLPQEVPRLADVEGQDPSVLGGLPQLHRARLDEPHTFGRFALLEQVFAR